MGFLLMHGSISFDGLHGATDKVIEGERLMTNGKRKGISVWHIGIYCHKIIMCIMTTCNLDAYIFHIKKYTL